MSSAPSYRPAGQVDTAAVTISAAYRTAPAPACALAGATMGTTWSARLRLPASLSEARTRATIQAALDEVVSQMSTWDADTDISRYNRAQAGWRELPAEFFHVLQYSLQLADATQGAYDPTVGPLVNAWGFGPHQRAHEPPGAAAIEQARARCGWQKIQLDVSARRAWQPGGVYLDLSSIAKGYGVDHAAQALERIGVHHYLLEVGGELRARGLRPDGQPWRVAIEVPDSSAAHALHIRLQEQSIATSGDYRRYAQSRNGRYAHTIDPRSGHPICHNVASVSVVHTGCMQADALATALTVLGPQDGVELARQRDLAALFILREAQGYRLLASPAFQALVEPQ